MPFLLYLPPLLSFSVPLTLPKRGAMKPNVISGYSAKGAIRGYGGRNAGATGRGDESAVKTESVSAKSIAALGSKYDRTHSANALLGRMRRTPAVLQACADVKPPLVGTTYISFRFAIPGFGCLYESHKNTNPTTGITISIGRTTPTLPGEKFFATII